MLAERREEEEVWHDRERPHIVIVDAVTGGQRRATAHPRALPLNFRDPGMTYYRLLLLACIPELPVVSCHMHVLTHPTAVATCALPCLASFIAVKKLHTLSRMITHAQSNSNTLTFSLLHQWTSHARASYSASSCRAHQEQVSAHGQRAGRRAPPTHSQRHAAAATRTLLNSVVGMSGTASHISSGSTCCRSLRQAVAGPHPGTQRR